MKTLKYNPSKLEVDFAHALEDLKEKIQSKLDGMEIVKMDCDVSVDNPTVKFYLLDSDGDPHEVVMKIIQTADKF